MLKSFVLLALIFALAVAGCATQAQFLASKQPLAMQTAVSRAQFDMGCQEVSPVVLSSDVIQPTYQGPYVGGIWRAEYTIGVSGCGKRHTYVVVCPQGGEGCFAAGPGMFHNWQP